MATTMNKNKVSDMAKDFGLTSKDILSVLSTYEDGSKKPSQVLSADEVNLIFEHLTQKHQVKIESIGSVPNSLSAGAFSSAGT